MTRATVVSIRITDISGYIFHLGDALVQGACLIGATLDDLDKSADAYLDILDGRVHAAAAERGHQVLVVDDSSACVQVERLPTKLNLLLCEVSGSRHGCSPPCTNHNTPWLPSKGLPVPRPRQGEEGLATVCLTLLLLAVLGPFELEMALIVLIVVVN